MKIGCVFEGWRVTIHMRHVNVERLGLSLTQHRGVTYHHAPHEIVPCLFALCHLAVASTAALKIVVSGDYSMKAITESMGVPHARIQAIGTGGTYCSLEMLRTLAPFLQDTVACLRATPRCSRGKLYARHLPRVALTAASNTSRLRS
jgi:hypothetical protein